MGHAANKYCIKKIKIISFINRTLGAFFHLLKSSLGSGLLAMPAAFKNTGLIPGCIGTILVGIIATHCVHILVGILNAELREESTWTLYDNYRRHFVRVERERVRELVSM